MKPGHDPKNGLVWFVKFKSLGPAPEALKQLGGDYPGMSFRGVPDPFESRVKRFRQIAP